MHKRVTLWVVTAIAILVAAALTSPNTKAAASSSWLNSNLLITKQSDTPSLPATASGRGNIDCIGQTDTECVIATDYGMATNGSKVAFGDKFEPVVTYMDGREHFFPVPNSNLALTIYNGGAIYGLNLAFNYNFTSSITKEGNAITGHKYRITRAPDAKLADKTNHLLPADTLSMSFSQNGRWMVLSSPNLAMLRVNLQTFEVLPFAPGFNYTIGLDPNVRTTISNDGRYAIVISYNFNTLKVYDLSTCSTAPDRITGPAKCQSRDLKVPMQTAVPGYNQTLSARFMSNHTLAAYVSYKNSGNSNNISRFIISDNNSLSQLDYLAVGDSYISGEGAFDYAPPTDTPNNQCHLSFRAYPYLIGKDLDYNSYHSVACSGAITNDITDTSLDYKGQADKGQFSRFQRDLTGESDSVLNSFLPGYIDQLDFVSTYQPQAITVSVGGDDMGFSSILKKCIDPRNIQTCYNNYEDRLELVRMINTIVFNNLVKTYGMLMAAGPPNMRMYAIGYPQIAKPGGDCGFNVHLNSDEVIFSQELVNYLDRVIKAATSKAGIYYVDAEDAFYGHRLCETGPGNIAMNGLTAGNDFPDKIGGPIGRESYHPNPTGYLLLENDILTSTHNLTAPMPAADPTAAPPPTSGLLILEAPHSNRAINTTEYDPGMAPDLTFRQAPFDLSINGSIHALPPNETINAELHSDAISLGSYKTDQFGNLNAQITIPASAPTGYHTIHFYGTDVTGQSIDIYKYIYVAKSADDLDGDGIMDSTQKCVGITAADVDYDKDGIDDACDANITEPPALNPTKDNSSFSNNQPALAATSSPSIPIIGTNNINDNQPLTASALQLSNSSPIVLGSNSSKPAPKYFQNEVRQSNFDQKRFVLGVLIMLVGVFGIFYRRRV